MRSRGVVGAGYVLTANNLVAAGAGFLFWIVAARRLPASEVGLANAVVAAVTTVAGIGVLGLNSALLRYIPAYAERWRGLVVRGYGASAAATLALAAAFALVAPRVSGELARLGGDGWPALLLVAAVAWTLFSLQDVALTARGRPGLVLVENALVGVARIVALVAAPAGDDPALVILLAWLAPTVLAVGVITALLLLRDPHGPPPTGDVVERAGLARYCAYATLGSASTALVVGFTPVLVTALEGPLANAAFFLPWTIATSLQVVATGMAAPLTVAAALDRGRALEARRVLVHATATTAAGALAVAVLGPTLLELIGSAYRPSVPLLVLLMLGAVASAAVVVLLAVPRARGDVRGVVAAQWAIAAIVLAGAVVGLRADGVASVGLAFLVAQLVGLGLAARLHQATARGAAAASPAARAG